MDASSSTLIHPPEVRHLFRPEGRSLIELLSSLRAGQWSLPTACPAWSVKDIVQHLFGVDVNQVSAGRDGYRDWVRTLAIPLPTEESFQSVVDFVNDLNQQWVDATRRISPELLVELLTVTGDANADYYDSLDLQALGPSVDWSGPGPAPMGLHVAREYTERWVHQQQIRDAVGRPGLKEPEYLRPVLATFVFGLPRAFATVDAPEATVVRLTVGGQAGGTWLLRKRSAEWSLTAGTATQVSADVTLDAESAWRLFTRMMDPESAKRSASIRGDQRLAEHVFHTVSIIA